MPDTQLPLAIPALGPVYQALMPWAELALRVFAGFALIPHGLRLFFGMFPNTGAPPGGGFGPFSNMLDMKGYKPGKFWAVLIFVTELICAPLIVVGLFTRLAALPAFILIAMSVWDHGKNDGYFWNTLGIEYPLMWTLALLYVLVNGGGVFSLDHLLLGWEF